MIRSTPGTRSATLDIMNSGRNTDAHQAAAATNGSVAAATGGAFERGGGLRPLAFIHLRLDSREMAQMSMHRRHLTIMFGSDQPQQ